MATMHKRRQDVFFPQLFLGSITKSIRLADIWSPYNEEPLDENLGFGEKELFLARRVVRPLVRQHLHRTAFGAVQVSKARAFDASRIPRLAHVELT